MPDERMRPIHDLHVTVEAPPGTDRATVALVFEAVKTAQAVTERGFTDVQRQLDGLSTIPAVVNDLRERVTGLDGRVSRVESDAATAAVEARRMVTERALEAGKSAEAERSYKKIHLPAIALGFLGFCLAVANRIWGTG